MTQPFIVAHQDHPTPKRQATADTPRRAMPRSTAVAIGQTPLFSQALMVAL